MARVTTRAPYNVRCLYSVKQSVKQERENRCVLSMFLNVVNVGSERMSTGRLFQAFHQGELFFFGGHPVEHAGWNGGCRQQIGFADKRRIGCVRSAARNGFVARVRNCRQPMIYAMLRRDAAAASAAATTTTTNGVLLYTVSPKRCRPRFRKIFVRRRHTTTKM